MKINSKKIRELRMNKSWSQETLAERSSLSVRTVQRIENGSNASNESLKLIANALDIDFDTIVYISEDNEDNFWMSILSILKKSMDFSSNASRREYWYFFLLLS